MSHMSKYVERTNVPLKGMPNPPGKVYTGDIRQKVKCLIEMSQTIEEADEVINKYYFFKTIEEKIAFLKGMFGVELISKHDSPGTSKEKSAKMDYWTMLSAIINGNF